MNIYHLDPDWQDDALDFPDVSKQSLMGCFIAGGAQDDLPVGLRSAVTADQDFRATTTLAAWGTVPVAARGVLASDLTSALHTYPNCTSTEKTTTAAIVWSTLWPCVIEIAASEIDPTKRMGTRIRNRNRIPRTNPSNELQIASVVTPPTPYNAGAS